MLTIEKFRACFHSLTGKPYWPRRLRTDEWGLETVSAPLAYGYGQRRERHLASAMAKNIGPDCYEIWVTSHHFFQSDGRSLSEGYENRSRYVFEEDGHFPPSRRRFTLQQADSWLQQFDHNKYEAGYNVQRKVRLHYTFRMQQHQLIRSLPSLTARFG